ALGPLRRAAARARREGRGLAARLDRRARLACRVRAIRDARAGERARRRAGGGSGFVVSRGGVDPAAVAGERAARGMRRAPRVDGLCVVGASFDLDDADPAPRASSHAGNLERLERIISVKTKPQPLEGRVAFRIVAPDRLPLVGKLAEGVYGALAYGSRGLLWAALAAEVVARELEA